MSDESQLEPDPTPAALVYPFEAPPARGKTTEVAPGVHWIRMPLPYALDHINLWAIDDDKGWAIVDTGTRTEVSTQVWGELFANAPDKRPLTRVFVTHMHPDHIGMAGWLGRKFGVRLWMTRQEYLNCRVLVSDTGREAPQDGIDFFRRAGWLDEAVESYRARFGNFGKDIYTLPDSYMRLQDGQELQIGAHQWQVVVGSGHSPEHACLYCPGLKLLISGDQVLPRISSNVSVHPTEPDADPMSDWMMSLTKLKRMIPDDVLVLPAHNDPFRGLHLRLDKLERGQLRSFERLRRALNEPKRVVDLFGTLFARSIAPNSMSLMGLATGETIACLNYLMHRGEITRAMHDDGAYRYQLVNK